MTTDLNKHPERKLDGPASWVNWRAFNDNAKSIGAYEFPLYSDALTGGEVSSGLGPYQFFNMVDLRHARGLVRVAVVVRVENRTLFEIRRPERTDVGAYHGGSLVDELSALASLVTGARFRAGNETRRFEGDHEPRGRPIARHIRPEPLLPVSVHGIMLPFCGGEHSLMPLETLAQLPRLAADDAIALIRAARLYQDALWVAETEPNLAWIMLVSAIETVANRWDNSKTDPLAKLRAAKPAFMEYLDKTGVPELPQRVATEFAESIGSAKKFVDFLIAHLPEAPTLRPAETWRQIEWSIEPLRHDFQVIYRHRSKALHVGIPFPAPMCNPVLYVGQIGIPSERPTSLGSSSLGGTWLAKDTPMYLHSFEYITRNAILQWWSRLKTA